MSNVLCVLMLLIPSTLLAHETQTIAERSDQCIGNVVIPSSFVDVMCTNGRCYGQVPDFKLQLMGECEREVSFIASGRVPPTTLIGNCISGVVALNIYSQNIQLYGQCEKENEYAGTFYATAETPTIYRTGVCQENGNFRIYVASRSNEVVGRCR